MNRFTVFFDANVFVPSQLRSFTMYINLQDQFRPRWSKLVHQEWMNAVLRLRSDIAEDDLKKVRDLMDQEFKDCLVTGFESLIAGLSLPDPDDRYVLAAAIKAGASVIVTYNLRDFPKDTLEEFGIEAQHPDEFFTHLFDLNSAAVIAAARSHRRSLFKPAMNSEQYLLMLESFSLAQTVSMLRKFSQLL